MDPEEPKEDCAIELNSMAHYGTNGDSRGKANGEPSGEVSGEVELSDKAFEAEASTSSESGASSGSDTAEKKKPKREQWDNRFQFVLTLIGYAVGLGNVWRFSYLCAKNGGVTFIIPYLIMLFVLGIPLFYLEVSLGQAVRKGPVKAWFKISPNLGGIGISALIVNSFIVIYYNLIIAWVFFYLFNTFHKDLPWGVCFGTFVLRLDPNETLAILQNHTGDPRYPSCFNASTEYFWYNDALGASESINYAGTFNWKLFLCLLLAWVVVYLCLFRGIKSSGKVIYFTATFPYVVLVCLFFRAVTLKGAGDGLKFLFLPSSGWARQLFSPQVWLEAATQIFFSLGLSIGALVALSSYTKPRYNSLLNSIVVPGVNAFTSIFSSIIIFSIVGFQAAQSDSTPELLARGPGLAFVVFTEAVLQMPGSPFWGFLFFVMLLTLGLDSQFATVEAIITVICDIKKLKKIRKELIVAIICGAFFIVSIPFVLGNGIYLFQLFDQFAGSIPLLLVGFFEFIAVGWVVGINKFFTEYTNPYKENLIFLWIVMWKFVGPIIMFIIFVSSVVLEIVHPLTYTVYANYQLTTEGKQPPYPEWAQFIGALIVLSSVLMIPVVLIVRLISSQSARDEGKEFITRQIDSVKEIAQTIRRCIRYRRGSWHPQVDEPDSIPYQKSPDHYNDENPAFTSKEQAD